MFAVLNRYHKLGKLSAFTAIKIDIAKNMQLQLTRETFYEWAKRNNQSFHWFSRKGRLLLEEKTITSGNSVKLMQLLKADIFCAQVSDALLFSAGGFIATRDSRLLADGVSHRGYDIELYLADILKYKSGDFYSLEMPSINRTIDEPCVFIGGSTNFGHFLFEYLSRLIPGKKLVGHYPLRFVVYDDLPERFLEFLILAGVDKNRIIFIPRGPPILFSSLFMSSCAVYRDRSGELNAWPEGLFALRETLTRHILHSACVQRRRLYLTRKGASSKRVVNETELVEVLGRHGFEVVDLADYSAYAQIEMVSNAEVIWSPMGAASAVTIFAPDDCCIVEMVGSADVFGAYNGIVPARCFGQMYERIVGRREYCKDNPRSEAIYADFRVEMEQVKAILNNIDNRFGVAPIRPHIQLPVDGSCG